MTLKLDKFAYCLSVLFLNLPENREILYLILHYIDLIYIYIYIYMYVSMFLFMAFEKLKYIHKKRIARGNARLHRPSTRSGTWQIFL